MAKAKAAPPAKTKTPVKPKAKPKKVVVNYDVELPDGATDPVSSKEVEDLVSGFIGGVPVVAVSDVPPEEQRPMQVDPVTGIGDGKVVWGNPVVEEPVAAVSDTATKITMNELRARAEAFSTASHNFTFKPKAD